MRFDDGTYIVLDLPPAPWVERVRAIRKRLDPAREYMPVEITIIGSSGVGGFHAGQDAAEAFRVVDQLASQVTPILTRFTSVMSFPGTNIFYYAPDDTRPYVELQNRIVATGLKFKESPFLFTPHCTIVDLKNNPPARIKSEVLALPVPKERIIVDLLSLYSLNPEGCHLLHQTRLGSGV